MAFFFVALIFKFNYFLLLLFAFFLYNRQNTEYELNILSLFQNYKYILYYIINIYMSIFNDINIDIIFSVLQCIFF